MKDFLHSTKTTITTILAAIGTTANMIFEITPSQWATMTSASGLVLTSLVIYANWSKARGNARERELRYRMLERKEQEQIEAIKRQRLYAKPGDDHSSAGPFALAKPSDST